MKDKTRVINKICPFCEKEGPIEKPYFIHDYQRVHTKCKDEAIELIRTIAQATLDFANNMMRPVMELFRKLKAVGIDNKKLKNMLQIVNNLEGKQIE